MHRFAALILVLMAGASPALAAPDDDGAPSETVDARWPQGNAWKSLTTTKFEQIRSGLQSIGQTSAAPPPEAATAEPARKPRRHVKAHGSRRHAAHLKGHAVKKPGLHRPLALHPPAAKPHRKATHVKARKSA